MPSHPLSLRKTRTALSQTITQTNAQYDAIVQLTGAVNAHSALLKRPFLGRLKWLMTGK